MAFFVVCSRLNDYKFIEIDETFGYNAHMCGYVFMHMGHETR
jgi:hypothetical protein